MKRLICWLLVLAATLGLTACTSAAEDEKVSFYYCRKEYKYYQEDSVISSESRSLPNRQDPLVYYLSLYFLGPHQEELVSPFPNGTQLKSAEQKGTAIYVELTDDAESMSQSQFTLGCTCLALTCMEFTTFRTITVTSGQRSMVLRPTDLLLIDDSNTTFSSEESQ